ncbi:transketolase [Caldalkalibacillus uzonensis]|uniref:Transketolase n=1 Tax=Caldalkalibacillus uzonensis TaxID=353224 RepID=A0ABU0CXU0_9BACI|nr:transketolase [Caldalkalibacillus uzonensis]MDQ0340962.1 transketolase [Caldalkalibacillus uzonensis]
MSVKSIEQLAINTIRTLSIDAIEKANSGHPGMPMGAAPMAYALWSRFLKHNPANPQWFNRDRFVLSAGHGSMLLYSLLHLFGYDLSMEEIKNFRQWGSKTPGHPEYGHTPGVEATTGPLGQGIGMAVGMAMAERHLAAVYNRDQFNIVDHFTYVICGDGDLMEGVAYEAASLAGQLKLGRLIVLYDSNDISLDGELHLSFREDVRRRFESAGWQYLRVEDGNDVEAIARAIEEARADEEHPTLIEVRTVIGYGSPNKAGTNAVHGAPLGEEEAKQAKQHYDWPHDPFHVPEEVREHFNELKEKGAQQEAEWQALFTEYEQTYPELAKQLKQAVEGRFSVEGIERPAFETGSKVATRAASGTMINHLAQHIPGLWGGSADLASSTKTLIKDEAHFSAEDYSGRNIWFGVREHAMGAALNGIALHGGTKPYGGTFFVFSDYLRPAIRLAALQKLPVVYVFTHDSIAVGEDGPTHEPIEQLPSLRAVPGLTVLRPADAHETAAAWTYAVQQTEGPVALVLTRQGLPVLAETRRSETDLAKGAYILAETEGKDPQLILLASGSEVSLVMEAKQQLEQEGIAVRVVSMPSWELFEQQSDSYKAQVLPPELKKRLAVEMAYPLGWERYVGDEGDVLGITTFGASAPGSKVMEEYGFTVSNVVQRAKALLNK